MKDGSSNFQDLEIHRCFQQSPYHSRKHSSYFQVYEELLGRYRNRPLVFVEVGVLNGGSLFMWREFFGDSARIIGIDFNPLARRWESDGFEIFIGNQADKQFWADFFEKVGDVDVILDDGGHTFEQQIVTVHSCIPHVRDGGQIIVEDTHTSYFRDFGYPSRFTFIEWAKGLIDNINSRFREVSASGLSYKDSIYAINFYESIVSFRIDRSKCFEGFEVRNSGQAVGAEDYRYREFEDSIQSWFGFLSDTHGFRKLRKSIAKRWDRLRLRRLREYF